MVIKANAKINLCLNVKYKRDDGYHELESIILPLVLHDSIHIEKIERNVKDDYIICDEFTLRDNKTNLCHLVLDLLRKENIIKNYYNITIHKNIFLKSGLGGGSADAAATINAVLKYENINLTNQQKIDLGIKIGCDIPFSLINKPSIIKGKGEIVEPFTIDKKCYVVLIKPEQGLETKVVFDNLNLENIKNTDINKVKEYIINMDLVNINKVTCNNLEDSAFNLMPELKKLKDDLINEGLEVVQMTGSGSTIFGLTLNKKLAKKVIYNYYKKGFKVELTTLLTK